MSHSVGAGALWRALIALFVALLAALLFLGSPRSSAAPRANSLYLPLLRTSSPPSVTINDNYGSWSEPYGALNITGEIHNGTIWTLRLTKITVDLLDAYGQIEATTDAYTPMIYIFPNVTTCFQIYIPNPPQFSNFQFRPVEYLTTTVSSNSLSVNSVNAGFDASSHSYVIAGQERNDSPAFPVGFPRVIGTLYDTQEKVIGCESVPASANVLMPGQSAPFGLTFIGDYYLNTAAYTLQTQ